MLENINQTYSISSEADWWPLIEVLATKLKNSLPQEILLNGDLGAGKTFLVGKLLSFLGASEPVSSPSYVLERRYQVAALPYPISHWDLYRLKGSLPEDLIDLPHNCHRLIEWGSLNESLRLRAQSILTIKITSETGREVELVER